MKPEKRPHPAEALAEKLIELHVTASPSTSQDSMRLVTPFLTWHQAKEAIREHFAKTGKQFNLRSKPVSDLGISSSQELTLEVEPALEPHLKILAKRISEHQQKFGKRQ